MCARIMTIDVNVRQYAVSSAVLGCMFKPVALLLSRPCGRNPTRRDPRKSRTAPAGPTIVAPTGAGAWHVDVVFQEPDTDFPTATEHYLLIATRFCRLVVQRSGTQDILLPPDICYTPQGERQFEARDPVFITPSA
jgi:hypothetical protein